MNISKALKVKNRLVGEIARLKQVLQRENSRRDDNVSTVDRDKTHVEVLETIGKLIKLKAAIGIATAPISEELALLAENKALINFYSSLPCREGEEKTLIGSNREALTYQWDAYINREKIDAIVVKIQKSVNETQDRIDDFNARTQVEWAE